ncbi:hypothetical protein [Streptomyces phytohabitans]|uniref:hypothetical protein n=1 Tax=Streptomyces phytohabitans TaxID=1150371 RepID=UPI00345C2114
MGRKVHLVGSFPPEITDREPRAAWEWVREQIGPDAELTALPFDGDPDWLVRYLQGLGDSGAVRAIREGDCSDYDAVPIYRLSGGAPDPAALRDGARVDRARELVVARRELADERAPVQLSRPNPLDVGLLSMVGRPQWRHPVRVVRGTVLLAGQLRTLSRAARDETADAARLAAEQDVPVVWQLETPAVLYALNLLPAPLRPLAARLLARQVAAVLAQIPAGAAVLHLCYGALARTELIAPHDTRPVVLFLNALAERLRRRGAELPPVHVPFAYGTRPPPVDEAYYAPLARLDPGWRLIAGVADERDAEASRTALALVERSAVRRAEGVATACGLGRHDTAAAARALALTAELASSPDPGKDAGPVGGD